MNTSTVIHQLSLACVVLIVPSSLCEVVWLIELTLTWLNPTAVDVIWQPLDSIVVLHGWALSSIKRCPIAVVLSSVIVP